MGGRASRQKGRRGEQWLADQLRKLFPQFAADIKRGWQVREGDDDPDVIFPEFWWEMKNQKKPNALASLVQASVASKGRKIPVAVLRPTGKEPYVAIYWEDFKKLLVRWFATVTEKTTEDTHGNQQGGRSRSKQRHVRKGRKRKVLPACPDTEWRIRLPRS